MVNNYSSLSITKGSDNYGGVASYALGVFANGENGGSGLQTSNDDSNMICFYDATAGERILVDYFINSVWGDTSAGDITINVAKINSYALYGLTANSVTIGTKVKEIGKYAFLSTDINTISAESSARWSITDPNISIKSLSGLGNATLKTYLTSTYVGSTWYEGIVTSL